MLKYVSYKVIDSYVVGYNQIPLLTPSCGLSEARWEPCSFLFASNLFIDIVFFKLIQVFFKLVFFLNRIFIGCGNWHLRYRDWGGCQEKELIFAYWGFKLLHVSHGQVQQLTSQHCPERLVLSLMPLWDLPLYYCFSWSFARHATRSSRTITVWSAIRDCHG